MFDLFCKFHFFLPHRHHDIFNFMNSDSLLPPVCFDVSKALIDAIFVRAQTFLTSSLQISRQPHRIFFQIGDKVSLALCVPPSNETSRCKWNITLHAHKCFPSFLDLSMRKNIFPCPRQRYLDAAGGCSECSQFRQKVFLSENLCYVHVVVCLRMHLCFNARCICQMCICQMFTFRMLCIGCYVLFIQCTDPRIKMPNADAMELLTRHSECHVMAVVICC